MYSTSRSLPLNRLEKLWWCRWVEKQQKRTQFDWSMNLWFMNWLFFLVFLWFLVPVLRLFVLYYLQWHMWGLEQANKTVWKQLWETLKNRSPVIKTTSIFFLYIMQLKKNVAFTWACSATSCKPDLKIRFLMGLFINLDVDINCFIQMFTHKSARVYRKWHSNTFEFWSKRKTRISKYDYYLILCFIF